MTSTAKRAQVLYFPCATYMYLILYYYALVSRALVKHRRVCVNTQHPVRYLAPKSSERRKKKKEKRTKICSLSSPQQHSHHVLFIYTSLCHITIARHLFHSLSLPPNNTFTHTNSSTTTILIALRQPNMVPAYYSMMYTSVRITSSFCKHIASRTALSACVSE